MDKVLIYLCCWHVFKAWHLRGTKKIKDVEVRGGILQDLHDVMYMSITHGETIDDLKEHGRVAVRESLHKHRLGDAWQIIFGLITINLVSDYVYHGLVFNFFCNNVIHPCALCLCLENDGWWVFEKCPIPTKTPN
jgi:hypothetical protein